MRSLVMVLNEELTNLETQVVENTPSGVSGRLRQSWKAVPATEKNPVAILGQSSNYFLPVEMGRKPGKGISEKGQKSVRRWAKLVLGLKPKDQKNFAFLLSLKYYKEGRPAVGFLGLAKPGSIPNNPNIPENPVPGSLLDQAFKRLQSRLNEV